MDVMPGSTGLKLSVRCEFVEALDDLPPAPFAEVARIAPDAPSAIALETVLRQWRLAVEFAVALGDEEAARSYAKAVDERSRRTAADRALRRSTARRIDPPRYRGLRVLRMHVDHGWAVTLGLGPAFSAGTDATPLLFQLVERAFGLPLDVEVRDSALRLRLEALRPAAGQAATERLAHAVSREIAVAAGGRESNDPLESAVEEIRQQLPREDGPEYTGELELAPVRATLTD